MTRDDPDPPARVYRTCRRCGDSFATPRRKKLGGRYPCFCSADCRRAGAAPARRTPAPVPDPVDPRPLPGTSEAERYYSDAEFAYLMAVAAYRKRHRRRFLTACEYLHVAVALGYARPAGNGAGDGDG